MEWRTNTDVLEFIVRPSSDVSTKRSILSKVSSIYDPLGLAVPFILLAKRILQDKAWAGTMRQILQIYRSGDVGKWKSQS